MKIMYIGPKNKITVQFPLNCKSRNAFSKSIQFIRNEFVEVEDECGNEILKWDHENELFNYMTEDDLEKFNKAQKQKELRKTPEEIKNEKIEKSLGSTKAEIKKPSKKKKGRPKAKAEEETIINEEDFDLEESFKKDKEVENFIVKRG